MISVFSKVFWKDTAERAVRTIAQVAASLLAVSTTGLFDTNWIDVASVSGVAGVASILMSIASTSNGKNTNASFLNVDPTDAPGRHSAPEH